MDKTYIEAVKLMLRIAPDVFEGTPFALKGGTAINLFVREMPRLSVDLDLVYVNRATPRQKALEEITASLQAIAQRLEKSGLSTRKVGNKEMIFPRKSVEGLFVNRVYCSGGIRSPAGALVQRQLEKIGV
jgi:predicted nucleotidyltransferase component of viral defense system